MFWTYLMDFVVGVVVGMYVMWGITVFLTRPSK